MTVTLQADGVEIAFADLRLGEGCLAEHAAMLSDTELGRAAQLRFADDRRRFIASRGLLRAALSDLTGIAPQAIVLMEGRYGKPAIAGRDDVHFSVSRAGDLAAFAFAASATGIDLVAESSGGRLRGAELEFCAATERSALARLDTNARLRALGVIWARKEALLKATGEGLTRSPASFTAWDGRDAEGHERVIMLAGSEWVVRDVPAPRGHLAALARRAE